MGTSGEKVERGGEVALRLEALGKDFGTLRALGEVTLAVRAGEVYGLLGPNGAGKSTALRLLLGFIRPDRGRAAVFGTDVVADPVGARERVGYLPGEVRLDAALTGGELLRRLGRLRPAFDEAYRDDLVGRLDLDLSKRVGEYSKGNRQKVAIVAALQHRPALALLDEPTSGLDPLVQRTFFEVVGELAASGSAVLFSSHVLAEVAATCDRVGVLREGELVLERPVSEIRAGSVRRVEIVFDDPVPEVRTWALPSVVSAEQEGNRATILVEGEPGPLIRELAHYQIRDVVFERPDLEGLFMSAYGEAPGPGGDR